MAERIQWLLTIHHGDEDERRRGRAVAVMALGLITVAMVLLAWTMSISTSITGRIIIPSAAFGFFIAFLLARFGRVTWGALILIGAVIAGALAPVALGGLSFAPFYLILAILVASLTLRPWHIWIVLLAILLGLGLVLASLPASVWADRLSRTTAIGSIILLGIVGLISFLGARSMNNAMREVRRARTAAEASAAALARSNVDLEAQVAERTAALQAALTEVQQRAEEQARLLAENEQQRNTIREMSVPVIPVNDTTVVIPLVGALDGGRLSQLRTQALQAIERSHLRYLVLDITGVVVVDSQVAQGIAAVVQSARLLGSEVLLVGIRPEVAQAIVQLGLNLAGMRTFSSLQTALGSINGRLAGDTGRAASNQMPHH